MGNLEPAKQEIFTLLCQIYGEMVGNFFLSTHSAEVIPVFVHNSFELLKQNLGEYKASEQLDRILSKHGVSVSSYD